MCGIVGLIGKGERDKLHSSLKSLSHRGPDDAGDFDGGHVWLAQARLSIVDLSSNGHQPMISNDGNYSLIFNGEIYNHLEIRNGLLKKGYRFTSSSDTETLLYALIEYGTDVLKKLNGIFAFAFYNTASKTVIIVRDHFGIKPLYYFHNNNFFGFSSEIKALINLPGFNKEISYQALFYYLQMLYAPGEFSPFENVKKLLPGHFLTYKVHEKSFTTTAYYSVDFSKPKSVRSEAVLIDELDKLMQDAVERQLMSDVPLGYFLSGGLDSSLIVALAKKIHPGNGIDCFTISTGDDMKSEGFTDDMSYAKKVAKHLEVNLNIIPASQNIVEFFDKMIWHLDEPQADPAPLHVYNIAGGARKMGIKVLLGGTGGDDIFSGYRRHQAVNLEKYLRYAPQSILRSLGKAANTLGTSTPSIRRLKKLLIDVGDPKNRRLAGYFSWAPQSTISALFLPGVRDELQRKVLPNEYLQRLLNKLPTTTDDLDKMLFLEMETFLPDHNLNYTDKMSMAASVEARVPFLDLDLVNFATQLPVHYKMRGHITKYLLRKVAERHLPHDVIYRPKTGFGAPVRTWLKTSLKPLMQERLSEKRIRDKGIFDPKAVSELIKNTLTDKIDSSYTIWSLMAIDSWVDQFSK